MTDKSIDNAIVDPKVYASVDGFHELFAKLRKEEPVRWTEPDGYRPFWTVSKHADIMEVERQNDKFLNDPRLTLQT
ncbi:MAG: cytochrome P450, partial [Parvibaculaceae bacterium]